MISLDRLNRLGFLHQLTFAYLTCERLYQNYVYFSNNFGFGSPIKLRTFINRIYDILISNKVDKAKIEKWLIEIEAIVPNTENFDTIFVSSALDASCAVEASFQFLLTKEFDFISEISTYATDTVDMYIQDRDNLDGNALDLNEIIQKDPLMQREITIQKEIIDYLEANSSIMESDIKTLLQYQGNRSNIGIKL